jgi:cell division protein FtsB
MHLHSGGPETADVEALKLEVSELKQSVEQLTAENGELKQRVRFEI